MLDERYICSLWLDIQSNSLWESHGSSQGEGVGGEVCAKAAAPGLFENLAR
jgi:hypothetical protein